MDNLFAWLTGLLAVVVPGFGVAPEPAWNGYVEAAYVYVAPASGGTMVRLAVAEGDLVEAGDLLFALEDAQHRALVAAAEARVLAAEAGMEDLATGSREAEIEVIRAQHLRAMADLNLARETATRGARLFAQGVVPEARRDQERAAVAIAEATVRQLEAQLEVAALPAREPLQAQAEANLAAARAESDKARADLADRTVAAPVAGRIDRLYFAAGEVAPAGTPVVALRPAGVLKVRFYLPAADRPRFALGQRLVVACDGCPSGLTATVNHFASAPQFTPPILFSRDERHRLTFLAEAVLDTGSGLNPGQPVTVARLE